MKACHVRLDDPEWQQLRGPEDLCKCYHLFILDALRLTPRFSRRALTLGAKRWMPKKDASTHAEFAQKVVNAVQWASNKEKQVTSGAKQCQEVMEVTQAIRKNKGNPRVKSSLLQVSRNLSMTP